MAEVAVPALAGHQFFRGMPAEHLALGRLLGQITGRGPDGR